MSTDNFSFLDPSLSLNNPARHSFSVTKSDTVELPFLPRTIRITHGGTLVFRLIDDSVDVTMTVFDGEWLDMRVQFVRATGTTASEITAFY